MIHNENPAWWTGTRGEWYVVIQVALIVLLFFGPSELPGWPEWAQPYRSAATIFGGALFLIGFILLLAGGLKLGPNLTPIPCPKDTATLIQTGVYGLVRHPMYSGATLMSFGWALWVHGWLTIGYAVIILLFLDLKVRREEKWLREKFPEYTNYQRRVRKLIPFVY
ncbi:MAG: isoprenylcysteine carboxylmethyltransferase family protein [candidate division Zixibacteria bacterium]|nr:isoprenylcysteine carboxylmethyltransferase family protein [candidate division Zixibacteria bacterium]